MNIILALLLLLSAIILSILFVPIKYIFELQYENELYYSFKIWSGFLFRSEYVKLSKDKHLKIKISGISLRLKNNSSSRPQKAAVNKKGNIGGAGIFKSFVQNRMYDTIWRLIRQLFIIFKPDSLNIQCRYGFYEPHITAWLLPFLCVFNQLSKDYIVNVCPIWDDEYLDFYMTAAGSISIILVIFHLMRLILKRSTWQFMSAVKNNKKKNYTPAVQPF